MSETFSHRVLPYDGMDGFLAGTLPFLREGIAAGDRVLAVTSMGSELLLRDALGGLAENEVEFVDSADFYAHPARTLADCLGDAEAAASRGRRLRILGEPAWTGRTTLETREWQRVEALVNVSFADTGAAILCAYAGSLPAGVLAAARRTHPESVRGASVLKNPHYIDPWSYSAQCDHGPLPDPPPEADELPIDNPDLYWLRAYVSEFARRTPLPEEDLQRLLVAVTEVMTNALRHGAPPYLLRMWVDSAERAFVCEVRDQGAWERGAGHGLVPPRPAGPGRFGLWAVRLLCSIVQIRTGDGGTVVRMMLRLPAVPAALPSNRA